METKTKKSRKNLFLVPKRALYYARFFVDWQRIFTIFVIIAFIVVWMRPFVPEVKAAGIDTVTTTLSDSEAVNTESRVAVVFTPTTALIVTDVITIYLGDVTGGVEWEDDDADMLAEDVSCAGTGYTFNTYVYNAATATVPMYMQATVTATVANNAVTCTFGDLATDAPNNPGAAGSYPVAVVTNDDSGAGVAYVGNANDVTVSVTVLPNLSLTIDNPDATYCTTTAGVTSCNLGIVLTTTLAEGNYDLNVGTNAGSGATISIAESGDLGTIPDCTEDDTIAAGTSDYGLEVTEDGDWIFDGDWVDNDTPIEASEAFAHTTAPIASNGDDITVKHQVAVDSTVTAGTHSHTVIWTVAGNF